LIQGGNILPIRQRVRRSSPLMWQDPYSLTIALDKNYKAKGQLYSDDGVGYGYEQGQYVWRDYQFSWTGKGKQAMGTLKSTRKLAGQSSASKGQEELTKEENEWAQKIAHVEVDQIVILGVPTEKPIRGALVRVGKNELLHGVVHMQGLEAASKEEGQAGVVVLKLPKVKVVDEWEIEFF
jgi:alpha 1,3-glucosidase